MAGQIDLTVSERDIRNAYQLHFNRHPLRKVVLVMGFGVIVGAVAAFLGNVRSTYTFMGIVGAALIWSVIVLGLIVCLNRFVLIPRIARKTYAQQADFRRPMSYRWDDDALEIIQSSGHWRRVWHEFVGWRRDDTALLLYQSDLLFNPIPVNNATQTAITEMEQQLIAHNIPKK